MHYRFVMQTDNTHTKYVIVSCCQYSTICCEWLIAMFVAMRWNHYSIVALNSLLNFQLSPQPCFGVFHPCTFPKCRYPTTQDTDSWAHTRSFGPYTWPASCYKWFYTSYTQFSIQNSKTYSCVFRMHSYNRLQSLIQHQPQTFGM